MKINPFEIERAILKDELVSECCVVGIEDEEHGSGCVPRAYIVLKENSDASLREIENRLSGLCNNNLKDQYRPKDFCFFKKASTYTKWQGGL